MEVPLQLTTRNVELSQAEEEMIRAAALKLESFSGRITSCRVLVEVPHRRGRTGNRYNVRLDLGVPGGEIVIRRQPHESLATAVQDAFRAAGRRVQDHVRRVGGQVKQDQAASRGMVTMLSPAEGYGFITDHAGREIYFDRKSVLHGAFDRLEKGMDVHYTEEPGEKGPQASTVALRPPRKR
jgi:cold shock CspA family protein/ribosome-associated translation inhibitor RaiA